MTEVVAAVATSTTDKWDVDPIGLRGGMAEVGGGMMAGVGGEILVGSTGNIGIEGSGVTVTSNRRATWISGKPEERRTEDVRTS